MNGKISTVMAFVLTLVIAAPAAQALCIDLGGAFQPNEVVLAGCGTKSGTKTCSLNGVQDGWATHGVVAQVGDARIFSWTRNTPEVTEQYVCRVDSASGTGTGALHSFSGIGGVPKFHVPLSCSVAPVCQ